MAYIAIKNREHKGVYKEKEFNKDIYKTKGISYRKFKDKELNEALKWAGVKDLKSGEIPNKKSNNKKSENGTPKIEEVNSVFKTIEYIRKQGYTGVCITMKNNDEIIIKVNDMYVLKKEIGFDIDKTILENMEIHINKGIEYIEEYGDSNYYYSKPEILKYDLELIKITNKSKYSSISNDYLLLDNFWIRTIPGGQQGLYRDRELKISRTIKIDYNHNDFWESYRDLFLNINDITLIKPLKFVLPDDTYYLGTIRNRNCNIISLEEKNKIEKIYKDTLKKYDNFKDILKTEINK